MAHSPHRAPYARRTAELARRVWLQEGYREASRYLSMLFLWLQILLLIDFGYTWNESWVAKDEASESESWLSWKLAILVCALGLYVGSICIWVYSSAPHTQRTPHAVHLLSVHC